MLADVVDDDVSLLSEESDELDELDEPDETDEFEDTLLLFNEPLLVVELAPDETAFPLDESLDTLDEVLAVLDESLDTLDEVLAVPDESLDALDKTDNVPLLAPSVLRTGWERSLRGCRRCTDRCRPEKRDG